MRTQSRFVALLLFAPLLHEQGALRPSFPTLRALGAHTCLAGDPFFIFLVAMSMPGSWPQGNEAWTSKRDSTCARVEDDAEPTRAALGVFAHRAVANQVDFRSLKRGSSSRGP